MAMSPSCMPLHLSTGKLGADEFLLASLKFTARSIYRRLLSIAAGWYMSWTKRF